MADATVPPAPVRRRRWPRVLGGVFLGLVLLLVIIYFVGTSSAFFKGVILSKASKAMGATITVSDASISPFSQVVLRDLKVQTTGSEPLFTAAEIRARYSLWDIIGGKINVEEVTVNSPTVQIIQNPDGSSNLDPFTKAKEPAQREKQPPAPSKGPSKPVELNVKKVALNNAIVRTTKNYKRGSRDVTELSNFNLTLEDLKNGQTGKLTLSGSIKVDNNPPSPGTNGTLQAKLDGTFSFGLSAALKPTNTKGQAHLVVERADGALSEVAALGANFNCEVTPTEIKQVALQFQKGAATLGQVLVSGPFDAEKTEGHLTVQVVSLDRQVLNLAGASQGIDFGSTTISCSNQIDLARAGKLITASGQLDVAKFGITRTNQTTPPLDLRCVYNVAINQDEKSALLKTLTLTGTQSQRPLLSGELASPMSLAWGTATPAVPDSTLSFTLTDLNLADWKPFIGDMVSAGVANLNLKLQSQQSGKQLVFDLSSQLEGLAATMGSNHVSQARVLLAARGQVADMRKVNLEDFRIQLKQQNEEVMTLSVSGQADTATQGADLQLTLTTALTKLLQLMPQPDVNITSGTVELKTRLAHQQQTNTVTGTLSQTNTCSGTLALADFTGRFQNDRFQSFGITIDLDVAMKDKLLEIRKASGGLRQGANPGGSFDLSGNVDTDKKSGQIALKLVDLNENALRPFLEAALGDKKLVSVSINCGASAAFAPGGEASVKADLQLSKLVASDPQNQLPSAPLAVGFQVDASLSKQVADIRQFQISLTPTARATNRVQLQGRVDMTQTNAFQGGLKLASESLDVTPYYDLFSGKAKTNTPSSAAATRPSASATPAVAAAPAPATNSLPFRNFLIDVSVGRFYLREIEITNWITALKLDGSRINLNPLQLSVNGAPVKATLALDLGVPGYQYDLSITGDKIPLEPLANSFVPDKRGAYKGDLLLGVQVKGIGTTGASLQKSLAGQLNFSFTNASIQVVSNGKLKQFLTPVALLLGVPNMMDSPLNWVNVQTEMGSGRIDFKNLDLVSPMFELQTGGVMPIAEVLTNSPFQNWPVNLYLSRTVAERVHLTSSGSPQTGAYAKLPGFLKVAGTLGDPKAQIDKTALAGSMLEKLPGMIPGLNEKTGGLLQGVGSMLSGGQKGATNQPSTTNTNQAPATNKPASLNNLLDMFNKPKK